MTITTAFDVDLSTDELVRAVDDAEDVLAVAEDITRTALTDTVPARLRRDEPHHRWRIVFPRVMTFTPQRCGDAELVAFYTLTGGFITDKPLPCTRVAPGDRLVIHFVPS